VALAIVVSGVPMLDVDGWNLQVMGGGYVMEGDVEKVQQLIQVYLHAFAE